MLARTIGDVKIVARTRTTTAGAQKKAELTLHGIPNYKAQRLKREIEAKARELRRFPPTIRFHIGSRKDSSWKKPGWMYVHFEGPTNNKKDLVRKLFDFTCDWLSKSI